MEQSDTENQISASQDCKDPDEDLRSATVLTQGQYHALNQHYAKVLEDIGEEHQVLHTEFSCLLEILQRSSVLQERLTWKIRELEAALTTEQSKNAELESQLRHEKEIVESLKKGMAHEPKTASDVVILRKQKIEMGLHKSKEETHGEIKILPLSSNMDDTSMEMVSNVKHTERRDTLKDINTFLEQKLVIRNHKINELQKSLEEKVAKLKSLQETVRQVKGACQMTGKKLQIAKKEISHKEKMITVRDEKLKTLDSKLKSVTADKNFLQQSLMQSNNNLAMIQKEVATLLVSQENHQQQMQEKETTISNLLSDKEILQIKENRNQEALDSLKSDITMLTKSRYVHTKKIAALEGQVIQAEAKVKHAETETSVTTRKLAQTQKELASMEKEEQELRKVKNALIEANWALKDTIAGLQTRIQRKTDERHVLQNELMTAKANAHAANKLIHGLTFDKTVLSDKVRDMTEKLAKVTKSLDEHEHMVSIYTKEITGLHKEVDAERTKYTKMLLNYTEQTRILEGSKEQISQKDRKIECLRNYIDNLKHQIRDEEEKNRYLRTNNRKRESQNIVLKEMVEKQKAEIFDNRAQIRSQEDLIVVLRKDVNSKIEDIRRLKVEYSSLQEVERNDSNKLVKLKEEIILYKEKMNILGILMARGESATRDQMKEIKLLNQTLLERKREINVLKHQSEFCEKYKKQFIQVQEDLRKERVRGKVLEEQVQHPSNQHRWRQLKGADPKQLQLIVKNQFLQKIIVKKMTLLDKKDAELAKLQNKAKDKRSSGMEVDGARLLMVYRNRFREMKDKCASLTSQVNMYHSHFQNYQKEIATLKEKLTTYTTRDYIQKLDNRH